jgi:hypothetical protein
MLRTPIGFAVAFAAVFTGAVAEAQPIVEVQAGAQAPMPPQPMRFILTNGTVLIGTQVGGDAEWVMVQTDSGVVQVHRTQISSMDYQIGQGAIAVVAPQPPPPVVQFAGPPPRRRGRGLLIAGSIVFGISYGLTALIGVTAGQESPSALWFLLPVAGPVMWARTTECSDDLLDLCRAMATTFGVFIAAIETAGMVMLVVGLSMRASSEEGQTAEAGQARPPLALAPVVTPGYQGLALRSEF